jgi:4-alpha-glucanotransferase
MVGAAELKQQPPYRPVGRMQYILPGCLEKESPMSLISEDLTSTIHAALAVLGVERLTLTVHDASFPSVADEDIGRGSPYGRGARDFLALAEALGFSGLQFGPQGDTTLANPSPYDGAHFTKSPLSIALATLEEDAAWAPLCRGLLAPLVAGKPAGPPNRTQYSYAWRAGQELLATLYARFGTDKASAGAIKRRFETFRVQWASLLRADGLYSALSNEHGTDDWRHWPKTGPTSADRNLLCPASANDKRRAERRCAEIAILHANEIERHLFGQFVLDEQHRSLRAFLSANGIALLGDMQIGFSHRDIWSQRHLFRTDYLMGAPPSRTNPHGQPWGYPVFDLAGTSERVLALLFSRLDRILADFDGTRIDHPHGLVCPWVYLASDPDPAAAVARGARLLCSPNLPDHPALAELAIPSPGQLSDIPGIQRYDDHWVRTLREDQVDRYGFLFDAIMARFRAAGWREADVTCEVLSTWPYPLRRVMERHGLGRFCVTQKADLSRPDDVYRSENASPRDWIMVGNHDTPPIWLLTQFWHGTAAGTERALALAYRLCPHSELRPSLTRWIAQDAYHLAHAMFAELFVGHARRVSMFFPDWLGMKDVYNRPGEMHPDNWMLRIPTTFAEDYHRRVALGAAFNPPLALALALAARRLHGEPFAHASLAHRLVEGARFLMPTIDPEIVSIIEGAMA